MTNHKNAKRARNFTKGAIASGLAAVIIASTGAGAFAADPAADFQAEHDAATQGVMTGQVLSIDVQDNQEAFLNSIGITIDEAGSVTASNAYNSAANDYPYSLLKASFDETAFTANSEFGSEVSNPRLDLVIGDNSFTSVNIAPEGSIPVPSLPVGSLFNPWNSLRSAEGAPGTFTLASVFPGASWTNGGVANDLNGETEPAVSAHTQTWTLDRFAPTAQRQADISQNGTQRGVLSSGLLNCSAGADCIVYVTPTVTGDVAIDENGNTQQATMAIGGPVKITVRSTLAAQAPVHTEANPYTNAAGEKVYFKAKNEGAEPVVTETDANGVSSQSYNLLNPSVPLKPWKFTDEANRKAGWNNPEISDLYVTDNADGTSRITQQTSSSFAGADFVGTVTDGANAQSKTVTVTSDNADLGNNWQYQGNVLSAGDKITVGTIGEATVVEATKGKLVLSYALNAPGVTFSFASATLGTSVAYVGYSQSLWTLPEYEMVVVAAPIVPAPETPAPETPAPIVPAPETPAPIVPAPDDSTTSEEVIPDEALTDELASDDLADTGASENIAPLLFAGGLAVLMGLVAIVAGRFHFKGKLVAKK